jgi:hypothetical protein
MSGTGGVGAIAPSEARPDSHPSPVGFLPGGGQQECSCIVAPRSNAPSRKDARPPVAATGVRPVTRELPSADHGSGACELSSQRIIGSSGGLPCTEHHHAEPTLCRFESRRPPLVLGAPARKRMAGEVEHAKGSSTGGTGCEATRRLSTVTTPGERTRGVRARPFPTSIDLTARYAVGYVNDQRAHRCAAAAGPDTT